MTDDATDNPCRECDVAMIVAQHPLIAASDWQAPLVARLLGTTTYTDGSRDISVRYQRRADHFSGRIKVKWADLKREFERRLNTYQTPVLTEFATLGLACILVSEFPKLQITEVTKRGERADYWLGDRECLLEVSGQQNGKLDDLQESKRIQLLDNPFGMPGFVCVAIYSEQSSSLWFYEVTQ